MVEEWKDEISESFSHKCLSRNIVYLMIQPELSNFPFEFIDYSFLPYTGSVISEAEQYFMRIPNLEIISNYVGNTKSIPQLKR